MIYSAWSIALLFKTSAPTHFLCQGLEKNYYDILPLILRSILCKYQNSVATHNHRFSSYFKI